MVYSAATASNDTLLASHPALTLLQQPEASQPPSLGGTLTALITNFFSSQNHSTCTTTWISRIGCGVLLVACFLNSSQTLFAQASVTGREQISGTVTEIKSGSISIKATSGDTTTYLIQDKTERAITLDAFRLRFGGKIRAYGSIPLKLIEKGMVVKLKCKLNASGKIESDVEAVQLVANDVEPKIDLSETPETKSAFAEATVVGRVTAFKSNRLQLEVPKSDWFKKGKLSLMVTEETKLVIDDDSLARVAPGDEVEAALVYKFASGEQAIKGIKIKLVAPRDELTKDFADQLNNKFSHLSDEPKPARVKRSAHFALHTDISDRQAQVLLAKLETMYDLVSGYYRAQPRGTIECYVVRDLAEWTGQPIPERGRAKILEPAGVTISSVFRSKAKAIVYSCDDQGVAQHEAVHAFCVQTFGSTGPTWYSEGMAEMGQYWKKGNLAVDISPYVARYLSTAEPKKLKDIVALGQKTGDSWEAYSWRWALCHLLASNPNYSKRFKTLGINLMKKRKDSFNQAFGAYAKEISFEYDQFIENFGNGYRADLCAWDWSAKTKKVSGSRKVKTKVNAQAGWQATKALVAAGTTYTYETTGNWQFEPTGEVDADGSSSGQGRLIGVTLKNFKLSKPFELGTQGEFTAQGDGQLYLRCQDDWLSLGDNSGTVEMLLQQKKEK